jgi:hypothetical protein
MTSILTSWARMALLAVPFADPSLLAWSRPRKAMHGYAGDTGYAGAIPETPAGGGVPARPNLCDLPF